MHILKSVSVVMSLRLADKCWNIVFAAAVTDEQNRQQHKHKALLLGLGLHKVQQLGF